MLKMPTGVSTEQHARAGGVGSVRHTGGLLCGSAALLLQHPAPGPGGRLPALPDRAPTKRRKFKVEMPSAPIDWEQMGRIQAAL